jgi:hypothetical protein
MQYSKPALTLEQQVALLKKRGMALADESAAKVILVVLVGLVDCRAPKL